MLLKSRNEPAPANARPEAIPAFHAQPVSSEKTVIGEHISIQGDIRGQEDLVIQGTVKGSVQLENHHLTVGPKGQVEAEIMAANVTISGRLAGNIKAQGKVEITREADFTGEIKAKRISVEDGAYLKAVIELEREPAKPALKPLPALATPAGAQGAPKDK